MARLVRHDANGPVKVEVNGEEKWICRCGLSENKPFCDGHHNQTKDEEDGKLYVYNHDGDRVELQSGFYGGDEDED